MGQNDSTFWAISIHALREEGDARLLSSVSWKVEFQSTPSARRATSACARHATHSIFQSTPSARRATSPAPGTSCTPRNFNPRPPRGERPRRSTYAATGEGFQSTPSARRATAPEHLRRNRRGISIHALREEGDGIPTKIIGATGISIHALREEGDAKSFLQKPLTKHFNPRPPRGERLSEVWPVMRLWLFQSTPSARRATAASLALFVTSTLFQSTPSARRATFRLLLPAPRTKNFNPRPPRGGRQYIKDIKIPYAKFQSTPSARRATTRTKIPASTPTYFNPRPPRGERLDDTYIVPPLFRFQSTPSARRATEMLAVWNPQHEHFNPRPPRGERQQQTKQEAMDKRISIHALREESDR